MRRVFISHWHSDHVAGLKCFTNCEFVYRDACYQELIAHTSVSQVQHGFLRDLIPADLEERSRIVPEDQFQPGTGDLEGFNVLDYWGDGSLELVDLPGHMHQHTGFLLRTATQRFFYVADAYWHHDVMLSGGKLPWLTRRILHARAAYQETQDKLRRLVKDTDWQLVACHCPKALEYVQAASD